jgi:subtilisin family serine protease
MAGKNRYLIGSHLGSEWLPQVRQIVSDFVAQSAGAALVKQTPVGRQVVEMTEDQMRTLAAAHPELIIEEDQKLDLFRMPGLPPTIPDEGDFSIQVAVVNHSGAPVEAVTIYGVGERATYKAVTDSQGRAVLQSRESLLRRVVASPRDTYWSEVVNDVRLLGLPRLDIELKRLAVDGRYGWGHRLMGFDRVNPLWRGDEVKVAVVDSGIRRVEDLSVAGGYNTLNGQPSGVLEVDEEGHGTHCAGIIAALHNGFGVRGGSPSVQLYSVKVFPGGNLSDLVEAIEWCVIAGVDVINLSFGARQASAVLAGALGDAYSRGITAVAAAGNDATHVGYPAAFPTVIAVSAIGAWGTFPANSGHALRTSQMSDWYGRLFAASFTNFGPEIDVCAPGVALLSTVPTGYASWDGTSMAAPFITSMAALIVQAYPSIRTGDAQQSELVKAIMRDSCTALGMSPLVQGAGLPLVPRALAAAQYYATPLSATVGSLWGV